MKGTLCCIGPGRSNADARGFALGRLLLGVTAALVVAGGLAAMIVAVLRIYRSQRTGYSYDLSELRRTDPALVVGRELGAGFPTGLRDSRAVAVGPEGTVFVAGDEELRAFDPNGRLLGTIGVGGQPGCLASGRDGLLLVGMRDRVERLARAGPHAAANASTVLTSPDANAFFTSLAVTDAEVFVADAGNRIVLRFDHSGRLLGRIGRRDADKDIDGFVVPSPYFDIGVAPDGLLRAANPGRHRIETYTASGHLEVRWGRFSSAPGGFCGCCNPVNFAILPDGRFITCEKGLTRVQLFDHDGKFLGLVAGPESFKRHDELAAGRPADQPFIALDVAVDRSGRAFILDPLVNRVRVFELPRPPEKGTDAPGSRP